MFVSLFAFGALAASVFAQDSGNLTSIAPETIGTLNITEAINNATASGIDLSALPIATTACQYLNVIAANATDNSTQALSKRMLSERSGIAQGAVDVHAHFVLDWYRQLVPETGGEDTPDWVLQDTLNFMQQYGIVKTVLANSCPQSNVFLGNQALTVALARLINLTVASIAAALPAQFEWFAVVPLPYTQAAIAEAQYSLDILGASGIATMTNHEGIYLGNAVIQPFWQYLNSRKTPPVVHIHPNAPTMKINNQFVTVNPTVYQTGLVEFYYETSRVFMDLVWTQTLMNYTNIHWISAHNSGAFPATFDRMLSGVPQLRAAATAALTSRVWYDSAGPAYPHQDQMIHVIGIPVSQQVFGSDFPYAPSVSYTPAITALVTDTAYTAAQLAQILYSNTVALFGKQIW